MVDGFITANEKKEDESSIIQTTGRVLHLREPRDLGYVHIPRDPQERCTVLPVQAKLGRSHRALDDKIQAIVNRMSFTRPSIKKGRVLVLNAIDEHIRLRYHGRASFLDTDVHEGKEDGVTIVVPLAHTIDSLGGLESKDGPTPSRSSLTQVVPMLNTPAGSFIDSASMRGSNGQGSTLHQEPPSDTRLDRTSVSVAAYNS